MALLIWLPLNGNLKNYGISTLKFSTVSSNTTVNNNGKMGKCYDNNSNTAGGIISDSTINLGDKVSMFCWVKLNSFFSSSSLTGILGQHRYQANEGLGITMRYVSASTGKLSINTGNGSGRTYNTYTGNTTLNSNTWYHVGFTYDKTTGIINFYVNGEFDGTATYANLKNIADYIQLFAWSFTGTTPAQSLHGNYMLNGYLNDVRIYDHVLSIKEIKEISKGLLLHYTFNDPYIENTVNLNSANWSAYTSYWTIQSQSLLEIVILKNTSNSSSTVALQNNTLKNKLSANTIITLSCYLYKNGSPYKTNANTPTTYNSVTLISRESRNDGYFRITFKFGNLDSVWLFHTTIFDTCLVGDICSIKNLLWEIKDHVTPYTLGTRTTTSIVDNSGFGNTGTITGTLSCLTNSARGTYCTNLVNSYITAPLFPLPETTIAFWINRNAQTGTRQFIYTGWYGISIELTVGNGWQVYYTYNSSGSTVTCAPTTILAANTWYHCALVIGTTGVKFYINGVCEKTSTYQVPYYNASSVMIGNYSSYKNFNAKLSDFRVYSCALTADDILNLYKDSQVIDNTLNLYCYELNEIDTNNKFKKNGVINTSNMLEFCEYLYLPSGKYVNTQLYYNYSDKCKAETIIRYAADGSGRDLMGYSGTASGYWGVKADGTWEAHGTFTYTYSDITKISNVIYNYSGSSNDRGYYQIGALNGGYSTRNKYIYHTKLWKNNVLERDLYPAISNGQNGLFDILNNVFYPVNGTGSTVLEDSNIKISNDNIIIVNKITEF